MNNHQKSFIYALIILSATRICNENQVNNVDIVPDNDYRLDVEQGEPAMGVINPALRERQLAAKAQAEALNKRVDAAINSDLAEVVNAASGETTTVKDAVSRLTDTNE
jgi:hypothetical protein